MVEVARPLAPEAQSDDIRASELSFLKNCLCAEHGSVVVVHGRRGVGKARLAEDLVKHAAAQPKSAVFEGRTPVAGAKSFHPFAEIARQALTWAESAGESEAVVDPVLADLEVVLDRSASDAESAPSLDQKLRFFDSFRRLLSSIAERARLCVVVHELERADSDTLELASFLADELFPDPALDPGHHRPGLLALLLRDDGSEPPRVREFLREAQEQRHIKALRLDGLDLDGLRRYVQNPRVLEKLLLASKGLPQELDALIDSLPRNVEELFERRFAGFDPLARAALSTLAVSGRPATARVLAEILGQPPRAVAQALNELREARVLERRIQNGEFQFSFGRRSDLEVTLRATPEDERARLHGLWARALAREPDFGGPALLAYHELRSSERQRGVPLAVQAAEVHAVAGAFDAAVSMLEEAKPLAEGEMLSAILARLAELAPLTGSARSALRYVEEWKQILPPSQRGRALQREAELLCSAGDYQRALEVVEEGRRSTAAGAWAEQAELLATASEAYYHLSSLDRAEDCARSGLDLLVRLGADAPARLQLELLNLLAKAALAADHTPRAIEVLRQTLALAEQSGLRHEQARALVNLGYAHMKLGAMREAEAQLCQGIEKAQEANDLSHLAFGHMNLGVVLHQKGELGRAIGCYRECKSLFRRLGNRTQLARVLHNLANLYEQCGEQARARAHNDEALRLARASNVERLVAQATALDGVLAARDGDRALAEARLREAMSLQRKLGVQRPLETMVELAEIQLGFGEVDRAGETLGEVEQSGGLDGKLLQHRAHLLRGRILLARDPAAAVPELAQARDALSRLARQDLVRDAEVALGEAHGRLGQREIARLHLHTALALQRDMAADLPEDLRQAYEAAHAQTRARVLLDEIERKPEPAAARPAARPAPESRPRAEGRRPEWASRYGAIVGRSPKLHRVFHILDRVAPTDGTVLIHGESGTGKELVAEAIHRNSPRAKGPFVKLNCAALVESLLLSELFGHERGSFTGAHQRKIGRFEMAAGGTIFLDEIGDISPKTQVSLLRVLQEREFERVGGGRPIKVEARIIVATNRNLAQMVREGTFREDLYYRLKGLTVDMPPLRERPEDVLELARHFLEQYARESGHAEKHLSPAAEQLLLAYAWPGNIRELENITRSVALFAEGPVIEARDFDEYRELFQLGWTASEPARPAAEPSTPPQLRRPPEPPKVEDVRPPVALAPPPRADEDDDELAEGASGKSVDLDRDLLAHIFDQGVPLPELKKRLQEQAIARALEMTKGNITRAAEVLGMRRPRLSQIINASEALKAMCQGGER